MFKIKKEGVILKPTKLAFESKCVFNPGVYQDKNQVHIFYRALDKDYQSTIGYARLQGPTTVKERREKPLYAPKYTYEKKGMEDPRITKIDDTFYVTYVAHDGLNAVIAYLYGADLMNLKRGGIISPKISYRRASKLFSYSKLKDKYYFFSSFYEKYADKNVYVWEKDGVLFPQKIRGKFALIHRILPDMQLAYARDMDEYKDNDYWHDHIHNLSKHVIMENKERWEARHIGAGAPPIKTNKGWLLIYHGVMPRNKGRQYYAGAALLDLRNPKKVIGRLSEPFFAPDQGYEQEGLVNNVVFPTGTAIFKDKLFIYYGTSDTYIAAASTNLNNLLDTLIANPPKP